MSEETMSAKKGASQFGKVFLFGDSLTQRSFTPDGCWGSRLADFLMRKCDIVPRGFSGYNTRAAKLILPGLLNAELAKEVVAMTILLGANDAASLEVIPEQHVPPEEYGQNLKEMVEHCLSVGLRRDQIILISPPAVCEEAWTQYCVKEGKKGVGSRSNKLVEPYVSMVCKIAKEMGTSLVDLHSKMIKCEDYPSYLCDGLHLSESGSQVLFNQLQPIISQLTSHIPSMLYPEWADINNDGVQGTKQSLQESGWI